MDPQGELFERPDSRWPEGLAHCEDFIDAAEEARLLEVIATLPLQEARYKGYVARRRVAAEVAPPVAPAATEIGLAVRHAGRRRIQLVGRRSIPAAFTLLR